jgi:hypothetical protein
MQKQNKCKSKKAIVKETTKKKLFIDPTNQT